MKSSRYRTHFNISIVTEISKDLEINMILVSVCWIKMYENDLNVYLMIYFMHCNVVLVVEETEVPGESNCILYL
jgi:hypothetical protein